MDSLKVDPSWLIFPVDPFDSFSLKDFTTLSQESLWTSLHNRHETTFFTLQFLGSDVDQVLGDPCFEYAEIPGPETFWIHNRPPKIYSCNVLGHSLPFISVPMNRVSLDSLVWKLPTDAIFSRDSLSVVIRRRPSETPQMWSFHITMKPWTGLQSPSEHFEKNDPNYWIRNQYDQRLLFKNCVPREPIKLSEELKHMVNGTLLDDASSETCSEEDHDVLKVEEPKKQRIKLFLKDSKSLKQHWLEQLWKLA